MWIDQRGSEVLTRNECRRLLAVKAGGIGRVGLIKDEQVAIVPVNYAMVDDDVLIQVGSGDMLDAATKATLVAFEVDDVSASEGVAWSVLVQGLATLVPEDKTLEAGASRVAPLVPEPGHSLVRIRTGVLSGRRFPLTVAGGQ
jgi:nitroimidazol reductase NimA-like FMN-containing flavoprotein (pyridoxamine 5'-phosphate oxidase superfamily)